MTERDGARPRAALGDGARGRPAARARRGRGRDRGLAAASGCPRSGSSGCGKDNFWQAADTGPCGPCSEIFFDRGAEHGCGRADCRPGCALRPLHGVLQPRLHGVRPAARQRADAPLPNQNVDTGLGVERGACLLQGVDSVFDTDGFRLIMDWVERESGVAYGARRGGDQGPPRARRPRPGDVVPDRRRRRALQRGPRLHLPADHPPRRPARPADRARRRLPARRGSSASRWATPTPSCASTPREIERTVRLEEERFRETLARGLKEFEALAGEAGDQRRGGLHARGDLRLPDRAHRGARRGARPGGRRRRLRRADGGPPRDLARERREHDRAARRADSSGPAFPPTSFVGYETTDVLTAVVAVGERIGTPPPRSSSSARPSTPPAAAR